MIVTEEGMPILGNAVLLILSLLLLAGCGHILGSTKRAQDGYAATSVLDYRLPKAVLPIKLLRKPIAPSEAGSTGIKTPVTEDIYAIEIGLPRYFGDSSQSYLINYQQSPLALDDFTIKVHSQERTLTSIQLTTEDKTDEIIVKIAETVALFESAPPAEPAVEILLDVEIDPSELAKPKTDDNYLLTKMKKLSKDKIIAFSVEKGPIPNVGDGNLDCSKGICYRIPIPYTITFTFSDGRTFTRSISLPNDGPIIALGLDRAAFVEKVHDISFTNGSPSEIRIKKPSEALAFVSIPTDIAKALLRVPAEMLKLKVDLSDQEKALAQSKTEKIKAEMALKEALLKSEKGLVLESSPAEMSLVFMFGSNGPWTNGPTPHPMNLPPGPDVGPRSTPGAEGSGAGGSGDKAPGTSRARSGG
jgi:hypothetical protein